MADVGLRRALGFWALVAYGVGDILGAGIYALVGKVAGVAGAAAWCSFGLAMAVAAFTALSYAELGARFPKSAGEPYFCSQAFRLPSLSLLIGWLVFASGIVSLATVSRAFSDYCLALRPAAGAMSGGFIIVGFLLLLAAINYFGIRLSSGANIVCTVIEASGLLIVLCAGLAALARGGVALAPAADMVQVAPEVDVTWLLVAQGAALAFFAYIGFEDMVNVAEEVREPARHLPPAIITALVVAGTAYIAIAWIATQVVPPAELAQARAPLLLVVQRAAPSFPAWLFTLISLFAVANTGLLNYIMASRLLYGMSQQQLLPGWLAVIDLRTRTPARAIAAIFLISLAVALSGTIEFLAGTSSFLLLTVFTIINAALLTIKSRSKVAAGFQVPVAVPMVGVVASVALMLAVPRESLFRAAAIVAVGLIIVAASSRRSRTDNGDRPRQPRVLNQHR